MFDRLLARWRGILISLIGIVATLWLGLTGQLGLYINPRYDVFTVVMAVIAGVVVIAAFAIVPGSADAHDHGHGEDDSQIHAPRPRSRGRTIAFAGASVAIVAGTALALLLVPPATLSTTTVQQRDMNSAALSAGSTTTQLVGGDYSTFTVKDWASLLKQGAGADFFAGKTADITGFVTPDTTDPADVFYVARFVITCCAVDAQPVGVPVYQPGWSSTYPVDSWVSVTGSFAADPSTTSDQPIALQPTAITPTSQPAQPYVY